MPNSDAVAQDMSSDPNGLIPPADTATASYNPLSNLTDSVDAPRNIFDSLPDAGVASNSQVLTPTEASSIAANSEAIDKARAGEFMSGKPPAFAPEAEETLKESKLTLDRIAKELPDAPQSQPSAKADASSGLNNLFQNYRKQQQGLLQIEAQATDADSVRRVRAQRLGRDAAFRAQAEQMYGIPGAKGGAFDMMVQMDSAKLNALASQKTADNSWNDILIASRKAPKAAATDEKLEEKIGKLAEASSKLADNPEAKKRVDDNIALLAGQENLQIRGLTPQQAQQEEFRNNQGYMQNLIARQKQGGVDAYGQPMTSKSVSPMQEIYARANEGMIPTFQVVPNKDGTMKFGGVGAQALTKMPQGTIFAVRDPKGTMSILSRDTNSASGFTMIDMGVSTGTKAKPAPRGGATPATVTDDSALASADPNIYSVAPALAKDAFSAAQSTGRGAIDMVRKYTPVDYLIPGTPSNDAVAGFITPGYKGRQPKKR
jgi:hypothetical protein